MRFFLAKETVLFEPGKNRFRELLVYRFCGILMLLMNIALSVLVGYIVWQGRTFQHHKITTIAMAAYTFTDPQRRSETGKRRISMDNENQEKAFRYTYSATERSEVESIRRKYLPKEEDKMEQLRRLDASVGKKGTFLSLLVGILSSLVMGLGMCCCLVWSGVWFVPGVLIGLIGIAGVALAYPVYIRVTQKERERIAPEILRLTDELLQ